MPLTETQSVVRVPELCYMHDIVYASESYITLDAQRSRYETYQVKSTAFGVPEEHKLRNFERIVAKFAVERGEGGGWKQHASRFQTVLHGRRLEDPGRSKHMECS